MFPELIDMSSHQKSGPTPEEWSIHKRTIIDMYKKLPLKRVQLEMSERYNFCARYVNVPMMACPEQKHLKSRA